MKLLLTSAGISNRIISRALLELIGKTAKETSIAFIPTAANFEDGDKGWLINDYNNLTKIGFGSLDIVDISALEREIWETRLKVSDVIVFGGGNTFHLMYWVEKSGLKEILLELLKTKVYVGISAGSCITSPTIYNSVQNLFDEKYKLRVKDGLNLVDFQLIPHLNSPYFTKIREEYIREAAKDLKEAVYAIDDNSAVVVIDDKVNVVGEGKHIEINV